MRILKRTEAFQSAELDGELVVIHAETGKFYGLKDMGLEIWRRLDYFPDIGELCADIVKEYDVDLETANAHVESFCNKLVAIGFAEIQ